MTETNEKIAKLIAGHVDIHANTYLSPWISEALVVDITHALDHAVSVERERCLKIVEDRTPPKHTTPLAAHVKAVEIHQAIKSGDPS